MAAAKKVRKNKRSSFLCSFGGCFGFSNKVSADHADGKLGRGNLPVNDQYIPAPQSEIHDDEGKRNASEDAFIETGEKGQNRGESCGMIKKQKSESESESDRSASVAVLLHEKSPGKEVVVVVGGEYEFDSMVGAVILMVTLVVMVIWGKVCAILCTAAWLYFVPRFRANLDKRITQHKS